MTDEVCEVPEGEKKEKLASNDKLTRKLPWEACSIVLKRGTTEDGFVRK